MLTLAIGDLHIPDRAVDIPQKFKKLLAPTPAKTPSNPKMSQVVCLGNITNSVDTLKFLHQISPSLSVVRGEFDDVGVLAQQLSQLDGATASIPPCKVVVHDNLKIGFTNGYQVVPKSDALALSNLARELDVDILIWGGTHKVEAYIMDGKFFINPGSATGAHSFDWFGEEDEEDEDEELAERTEQLHVEEEEETEESQQEPSQQPEAAGEETSKEADAGNEPSEEADAGGEADASTEPTTEPTLKDDASFTDQDIDEGEINNIPSFCLLDTYESTCTLYIYTYLDDEVKVDKVIYNKQDYFH